MTTRGLDSTFSWLGRTLRGPIAKAATVTLLLRVVGLFLGMTTTVVLGRILGASGFGVYAVGLATAAIIAGLSQSGISPQILKSAATAKEKEDWSALNGVRRITIATPFALAAILFTLLSLAFTGLAGERISPFWIAAAIGALIAPFALADAVACALLRGIGRAAISFAPRFLIMQGAYLAIVVILARTELLRPDTALLAMLVAWLVAIAAGWFWIDNSWPKAARGHRAKTDFTHWRKAVLFTSIASIGGVLFGNVETFFLSHFSTAAEVGVFALAFRFAQFVSFPIFALGSGLAPVATAAVSGNRLEAARKKTIVAARIATAAAVAAATALAISGAYLFPAIRPEFSAAYPVMNIIAAGLVFQAMLGYPLIFIIIFGIERVASLFGALITATGMGFIIVMAASYGAIGAAIAGTSTSALMFLSRWVVLYRATGVRNDIFASPCCSRDATNAA